MASDLQTEPTEIRRARRRVLLAGLVPVVVVVGAWAGGAFGSDEVQAADPVPPVLVERVVDTRGAWVRSVTVAELTLAAASSVSGTEQWLALADLLGAHRDAEPLEADLPALTDDLDRAVDDVLRVLADPPPVVEAGTLAETTTAETATTEPAEPPAAEDTAAPAPRPSPAPQPAPAPDPAPTPASVPTAAPEPDEWVTTTEERSVQLCMDTAGNSWEVPVGTECTPTPSGG